MKSTRKEVKDRIHSYIESRFDPTNYGRKQEEFTTFHDIAVYIFETFSDEYRLKDPQTLRYYRTQENAFISWLQGLPSVLDPEYYYKGSAVDLVGNWMQETEEERNRFTEDQAEYYASRLIYREIMAEMMKEYRKH